MCTLYERIQELCKKKGVSGSRMCLELGISKSTLSDIKSGRKKGVSTETAQKISDYLGVSVDYLLTGESEQKEKPTPEGELDSYSIKLLLSKMSIAELNDIVATASAEIAKKIK